MIVVYMLIGWFYWHPSVVRVLAKPDEAEHVAYLWDVRQGHLWPAASPQPTPPLMGDQRCQPPLYYILTGLLTLSTPLAKLDTWVQQNPFFLSGPSWGNQMAHLNVQQRATPLFSARIISWLLGALEVVAIYYGLRAWRSRGLGILVTFLVMSLPSVLFIQTGVSSVSLMGPLHALLMGELYWAWHYGLQPRRARRVAVLFLLALYTRREALLFVIPLTFLLLYRFYRRDLSWRALGTLSVGFVGASPIFLRNMILYGDWLAAFCLFRRPETIGWEILFRWEVPRIWKEIFLYTGSGGLTVNLDNNLAVLFAIIFVGMSLIGWGIPNRFAARSGQALLALSYFLALAGLTLDGTRKYIWGASRYISTHAFIWLALWGAGYLRLWPRNLRRWGAIIGMLIGWGFSIYSLLFLLLPAYVPQTVQLSSQDYLAQFSENIRLIAAHVNSEVVRPGDTVHLDLIWEATRPVYQNYAVFVQALRPDRLEIIAQEDTYSHYGAYPTSWWKPGQPFRDPHRLIFPSELDVREARLVVGLYRYETMERLPAFAPDGQQFFLDMVPIGMLHIIR